MFKEPNFNQIKKPASPEALPTQKIEIGIDNTLLEKYATQIEKITSFYLDNNLSEIETIISETESEDELRKLVTSPQFLFQTFDYYSRPLGDVIKKLIPDWSQDQIDLFTPDKLIDLCKNDIEALSNAIKTLIPYWPQDVIDSLDPDKLIEAYKTNPPALENSISELIPNWSQGVVDSFPYNQLVKLCKDDFHSLSRNISLFVPLLSLEVIDSLTPDQLFEACKYNPRLLRQFTHNLLPYWSQSVIDSFTPEKLIKFYTSRLPGYLLDEIVEFSEYWSKDVFESLPIDQIKELYNNDSEYLTKLLDIIELKALNS